MTVKRSELIVKMVRCWDTSKGMGYTNIQAMDRVLEIAEENGMAPPGIMKPLPFDEEGRQYPLIPGDFKNEKGIWCTPGVQEWEDEDSSNK